MSRCTSSHEQPQIGGGGLTTGDDVNALFVERHLEAIDLVIAGRHFGRKFRVVSRDRFDCITQLLLNHAAHFHQAASDDLQLCVVLFRDVPTQLMHLHCLAELY